MSAIKKTPSNKFHERINQNRIVLWFFMGGNRWHVTGALGAIIFLTLIISGYFYPAVESSIRSSDSVDALFQGLLTAIISGVTIVVSLNQLVLSQELGTVEVQRKRMEGSMQFREDVAAVIQAKISPSRPAQFIRALVQVSGDRAKDLQKAVSVSSDKYFRQETNEFCNSLIENAEKVAVGLSKSKFGDFDVISSALNFNYSWKIFNARRIKKEYNDLLTENGLAELEKLIEVLNFFGPTREHFKTLYFQRSLIELSQKILLSAIPALLVSCFMIIFFNSNNYSITIFEIETLVIVIALTVTISVLPFLLLISYVLRITTITKYTLSIGPFILQKTDEVEEIKWEQ